MAVIVSMKLFFMLFTTLHITQARDQRKPCIPRQFGVSAFSCVCNATYCDNVEPNSPLAVGKFATYTSSIDGLRLEKNLHYVKSYTHQSTNMSMNFTVDRSTRYQTILGFGGAFTDAAGINMASLSNATAQRLLASYFGPDGIQYSLGRIPIASCDFSTRVYSYDDVPGDLNLTHFALVPEDFKYKINFIQEALELSGERPLRLTASPWSAPGWMKDSGQMAGAGVLLGQPGGQYYKSWANYMVKFVEAYRRNNITIWAMSAQNEPTTGYDKEWKFQTMGFTADTQKDFVVQDLGPALEKAGLGDVKVMILDDMRSSLPQWAQTVLSTPEASRYIAGIALHWYYDDCVPAARLTETHEAVPDKFMLYTEACNILKPWQTSLPLTEGSWGHFERYSQNIMEDLSHWVTGWTDWNLALDQEGGPNWVKNFVDSPVIVDKERDEFYKQPMFYALGHFSKFLPPGCVRIGLNGGTSANGYKPPFQALAFNCPDNSTVVQIRNSQRVDQAVTLKDPDRGVLEVLAPIRSQVTVIWW